MEEKEKIWPKLARFTSYDGINKVFNLNNGCCFWVEFVLSKRYWFIEWLVNEDKIEFYKVSQAENELEVDVNVYRISYKEDNYYWLLMILAIQDEPAEFLVSILK